MAARTDLPKLPGVAVRRRRVVTVYLPAPARRVLYDRSRTEGLSLGQTAMAILRLHYDEVAEQLRPPPPDPRFPLDQPRQRVGLDDPRQVSLSISPAQAAALATVLDELACSASSLFTAVLEAAT